MLKLGAGRNLGRVVLTACLGYVLAFQLILAGLSSGVQAAQTLNALALNPHTLCLTRLASGSPDRSGSMPAGTYHYDLCCTLACGVELLAPQIFAAIAYATAIAVVHATVDFGARPGTVPPGLGRGPRAPPF